MILSQVILGEELRCKHRAGKPQMCAEGVCEETTKEESYEQTRSNSVKWNFKNKPGRPAVVRTGAAECQVSLKLKKKKKIAMSQSGQSWQSLLLRCLRAAVMVSWVL